MPVLFHVDEYDQWLRGTFDDAVGFQNRCFPDDLIEMVRTNEHWVQRSAPKAPEERLTPL